MRTMDTVPTLPTPARRRRRWSWILAAVVVLLAVGTGTVYAAGGYLAYEELSVVHPHCGSRPFATQTPADFTVTGGGAADAAGLDITPYRFSDFSEVEFPTRGGGLTIRAWYAPPRQAGGPVVVVVHGRDACRRDWSVLLPAGMLHRAGFGVVLPDLRNHGDSDIDNGRWAGGAKEYLDVLGAWDWLRGRGVAAERIGLVGMSLGAATVTIATGEEPAVAATWADSPYATYGVAAAEYAESNGYPSWVAGAAIPVARLLGESRFATLEPAAEVAKLAGRPFFIVQGIDDTTVRAHNAIDVAAAAEAGGTFVEPWLVPKAGHTREVLLVTDRYEARLIGFFSEAIGAPSA
jgi:dipeptidyl aminopeptidase/acylaminoacyl peptidase